MNQRSITITIAGTARSIPALEATHHLNRKKR
jgi:hypothetical protein